MADKKKNNKTLLIIGALIVIVLLYKSGFMGSFVTTCNNIEPDTTNAFSTIFVDKMDLQKESSGPAITINKLVDNATTSYTFPSTKYVGNYTYYVFDINALSCNEVINTILQQHVDDVTSSFDSQLIIPDYDSSTTYYYFDDTTYSVTGVYLELTTTPIAGQVYYELVGDDYVQMPVPYMTAAPTLTVNPYEFYTPANYKSIDGKIIDGKIYWCSNNGVTMIMSDEDLYDSLNAYGSSVIVCETHYINDTEEAIDKCIDDEGDWVSGVWDAQGNEVTVGACECPVGNYTVGKTCEQEESHTGTGTGNGNGGGTITELPPPAKKTFIESILSNKLLLIGIIVALVGGYYLYQNTQKKGKKKRR